MQIRTAYPCRLRRQTEELWAAMNVCPFAPEIDPPDRFLPAATALTSLPKSVFREIIRPICAPTQKTQIAPLWGCDLCFWS